MNIEKNLLKKSDSKIKKHINIMINKFFKLREEEKEYIEVIILDKFGDYLLNKLFKFYQLITNPKKENSDLGLGEFDYRLLF